MSPYNKKLTIITFLAIQSTKASQIPFWIDYPSHDGRCFRGRSTLTSSDSDDFLAEFSGITTFAHLPSINCLNPKYAEESKETFDVAIIGAPFDTTVTYRPGYVHPR
jgi:hypothetical protein